jgi:uncharacterized protein
MLDLTLLCSCRRPETAATTVGERQAGVGILVLQPILESALSNARGAEAWDALYNVIDADGHILEPLDLWDHYIDPAFRDRAPRIVKGENGTERLVIEEHAVGDGQRGIGRIGAVGARRGVVEADTLAYKDGKPGGFDPHKRIPDMDADGIDAAFLYPSLGLFSGAIHDPKLAAATCRAYNRWLADYCKPYPDRLFGVAMLPLQDVDLAVEEMTFAGTVNLLAME